MGYDMYWDEEPVEVMTAQMEMRATDYDRDASDAWSAAQHKHVSYWRENVWGMGGFRAVLLSVDAIDDTIGVDIEPDVPDEGDKPSTRRFQCNSGWWVTPDQCKAIATKLLDAIGNGELETLAFVKATGRYGNADDKALDVGRAIMAMFGDVGKTALVHMPDLDELESCAEQIVRMVKFFRGAGEHGNGIRVW